MNIHKSYFQRNPDGTMPQDIKMPALSTMLDDREVHRTLRAKLPDIADAITGCEIFYIRYKPLTNCIIAYSLKYEPDDSSEALEILCYAKLHTDPDFNNAAEKIISHRWMETSPFPATLVLTNYNAIIYFFPNDGIIDGLRLLSNPKKIQRVLYAHYDKYPEKEWRISDRRLKLTPIRFKPERRVVLRCRTKTVNRQTGKKFPLEFYIRIYADERGSDVFDVQRALYDSSRSRNDLTIPRPIAYLSDRRALLMESVPGKSLIDCLDEDDAAGYMVRTARALAALHNIGGIKMPVKQPGEFRAEIMAAAEMLSKIIPEEMVWVDRVREVLKNNIRESTQTGPVHGDFHYGQILFNKTANAIIDFDRAYLGDGLADAGNFIAHLRFLRLQGRIADDSVLIKSFLNKYGELCGRDLNDDETDFWTAYHMFMLAVGPFRCLEPNWKRQIRIILEECAKILTLY